MAETVVAKALETEAVVWRQRKERECLRGGYVGSSQWNQRGVVTVVKISAAVAATEAEGIWAVVLAAAKVAMASAGNSSNGGAGNCGRNRGSGTATTINQHGSSR
jgi:hypothetical protein